MEEKNVGAPDRGADAERKEQTAKAQRREKRKLTDRLILFVILAFFQPMIVVFGSGLISGLFFMGLFPGSDWAILGLFGPVMILAGLVILPILPFQVSRRLIRVEWGGEVRRSRRVLLSSLCPLAGGLSVIVFFLGSASYYALLIGGAIFFYQEMWALGGLHREEEAEENAAPEGGVTPASASDPNDGKLS